MKKKNILNRLVHDMRSEVRRQGAALLYLIREHTHWVTNFSLPWACLWLIVQVPWILILWLKIMFASRQVHKTDSTNSEGWLYIIYWISFRPCVKHFMCITLLNPPGNSMTQIDIISVTVCKLRLSKFPEVTQFVSGGAKTPTLESLNPEPMFLTIMLNCLHEKDTYHKIFLYW